MDALPDTEDAALTAVEGIDRGPVSDWLAANVAGAVAPFSFELIAGGRSNLTYRVTDAAGHAYALRRPPVSHVLATAHDMTREHTVISALQSTDVPVPRTLGLCTDAGVNGAPFFVMSFVEGHILRDEQASAALPESVRSHASESLVDTLARLHSVDVDAVGLGEFARREGYIARRPAGTCGDRPGVGGALGQDPRAAGRLDRARRLPTRQHRARRPG
jgi:aminoglycoside phosphotransferase (APT) family kinase protein